MRRVRALVDLHSPAFYRLQGVLQFGAHIAAVRKDVAQHGIARGDSLQHIQRVVTILNPGAMDLEPYAQSGRIGTNVVLVALDLFSGVISSNPATFCGFYTLTIDDPGCQMGVSALGKARGFDRFAVHLIKQAIITPSVEGAADSRNRRKVVGQHAPLAASRRDIQDRVEHIAQIRRSRAACSPEPRH